MQSPQRRSRLARCLVLGLAIVAIAVPVAQADVKTLADYPPAIAREAAKSYGPLQADVKTLADYPPAIAREAAKSYGPLPATPIKTLADYRPAIGREAAKSYGPLQATPIKTLTNYPPAIAREAAKSYGSLPATPSHVVSQPGTFDWADATIDAATALALLLVGSAALAGRRRKSHPTG
jgi:hypothetical protein